VQLPLCLLVDAQAKEALSLAQVEQIQQASVCLVALQTLIVAPAEAIRKAVDCDRHSQRIEED
jgi:hypothetical protein